MKNLKDINLASLAVEIQGLTTSLKEASAQTAIFKEKLNNAEIPKGKKGNEKDSDPFEIALAALGIHVPTDEEMKKRKEKPDDYNEKALAVSMGIIALTKDWPGVVEKSMVAVAQTLILDEFQDKTKSKIDLQPNEAPKDATKTNDSLYPNSEANAIDIAEGYNALATKIIPGIAGILSTPVGQAIISGMTYISDEIKQGIGDEIYKSRKAPKNSEEYFEENRAYFEQEEENRKKGGRDYYWNHELEQKRDATDVKTNQDVNINSNSSEQKDNIIHGNPGYAPPPPIREASGKQGYGVEKTYYRNSNTYNEPVISKNDGRKEQPKGPNPFEVFQKSFGEAQKLGGALNTVMKNLNIGAHTFVGGLINGFNDALGIIQTVVETIKALQTIGSVLSFLPFASGGTVPGFGDTDSVPAVLTPGEFVVKKSVVNKFGSGFFEWINGGGLTNSLAGHYAGGGIVSGAGAMQIEFAPIEFVLRGDKLYGAMNKYKSNSLTKRRY